MVCEDGYRKVEDLRVGDRLAARDEFDPGGPIEYKPIEEVFERRGLILEVTVGGQAIGTTAEHPFYVHDRGWTPAGELQVGDLLATADGRWLPVEKFYNTGNLETVYNFRVADHHTYFVGDRDWAFSVWAHNARCSPRQQLRQSNSQARKSLRRSMPTISSNQEAHHVIPFELKNHMLVGYAASRGWEINRGQSNGAALGGRMSAVTQHNGSHPRYKDAVEAKLDSIIFRNGGLNDAAFNEFTQYVSAMQRALPRLDNRLK
ncbi:MAG: polymorphic toxin-type HINT domain-containing protein [Pirellulales bacterium]